MNTPTKFGIVSIALLVLVGCIPEKRIVWSADGKRAAVLTDENLLFVDEEGNVLKPNLGARAAQCDWFSDGKRLVVCYPKDATGWESVSSVFDDDEKTTIQKHAKELRERILAYSGDWDKFALDPDKHIPSGMKPAVALYLRDKMGEGLAEHLGTKWQDLQDMDVQIWVLQVFTLGETELTPGETIVRSLNQIHQPKLAPNDKNIALLVGLGSLPDDIPALHVAPVQEAAQIRVVAPHAAYDYDWSPDGRSLVFIRSSAPDVQSSDNVVLGSLTTAVVAGEDGELLSGWEAVTDRAGLLFNNLMAARWLSDGRLVFSSVEVTLPATSRDMPKKWTLFVWDPKMPASVSRILGRDFDEPLETDLPLFEISPDEKRVLLPGPDGRVTLYNFASGEATPLVKDDAPRGRTRTLATWKNNFEVCFATNPRIDGEKTTPGDIIIWRKDKTRILSESWPEEMKSGWLTEK